MTDDPDAQWRASQQRGQLEMTGDDWTSERDKKAKAKAEAAYRKAASACVAPMERAAAALRAAHAAYLEAGYPAKMGAADQRLTLASDLEELARHIEWTTRGAP